MVGKTTEKRKLSLQETEGMYNNEDNDKLVKTKRFS